MLKTILILALCVAIPFGLDLALTNSVNAYIYSIAVYAGINIIAASSLNLVSGITGQFSMGHAGFMAVGAYSSSFLSLFVFNDIQIAFLPTAASEGFLFAVALIFGGMVSALLGLVVGIPSLRLKGDYLAIVTLGFGEIIRVLILNIEKIGGARGLPGIPKQSSFTWVYSFAAITVFSIYRIVRSHSGRAFLAIREDQIAAESMGVPTTKYKVISFMISSFFAGVSGGLFAHFLTYLNPAAFDFNKSFEFIIMVVLGGLGSLSGSVFAAVFLTVLREALRPLQEITKVDLRMVIYAALLIVLMLTRPNGLFSRSTRKTAKGKTA